MSEASRVWQLVRGDVLLAELVVTGGDFPWLNAEVRPAAGFADLRPLFDDELQRLEYADHEPEQQETTYRRIREVVRLLASADGQYLSSCFTSRVKTPGGDGVMNSSLKGKTSRNSLVASAADC